MSEQVCPYCRTPVELDGGDATQCPACGTPHHLECWEENCGCTVFGCAEAPVEEAKITVDSTELGVGLNAADLAGSTGVSPPPPVSSPLATGTTILGLSPLYDPSSAFATQFPVNAVSQTERSTFVLLGLFFGYLGVHNLYANRTSIGIIQLCVTMMTCFVALPVTWVWALVEVGTLDRDGYGQLMR